MLKIGDLVEVEESFYWYADERYEIGERFTIEAQHIRQNFEKWVKIVNE